jgi:hypothetical protein
LGGFDNCLPKFRILDLGGVLQDSRRIAEIFRGPIVPLVAEMEGYIAVSVQFKPVSVPTSAVL